MAESVPLCRFDLLGDAALVHAVTTRLGGVSQGPYAALNLGHTVGDAPEAVERNHALLFDTLGISAATVVSARQVHGSHVAVVSEGDAGRVLPVTDALVTATPGLCLMLRYADCVPVLLYDARLGAVGLVHAGRQGVVRGVVGRAIEAMTLRLGSRAADVRAAIGPSIGPCCYEVGPEVVAAVRTALPHAQEVLARALPSGHAYLNLWAAVEGQLRRVGVEQIEVSRLCTACRTDLFYSHRAEGGLTGRLAAIIGLRQDGV